MKENSEDIGKICNKNKLKCEMKWKMRKKSRLNSEKIWEIWKERKLNSEEIWKIQKKIVQRYGNYGRKVC